MSEAVTVAHVETAPSGRIVRVDAAFCNLSGRPEDALVGELRFVDVLAAGSKIFYEMRSVPLLDLAGTLTDVALDIERPDGSRTTVLVTATLERTDSGQPRIVRFEVRPTEA